VTSRIMQSILSTSVIISFIYIGQINNSFIFYYSLKGLFSKSGTAFGFNLWQGLQQMHQAKLFKLYYLILIWSGIFPYLKVFLLLGLKYWRNIDLRQRIYWMTILARLSLWSIIDVCLVAFICIIVSIHEEVNISGFLHYNKNEIVNVEVVPLLGVLYLCLGLLLSQCMSVWAISHLFKKHHHNDLEPLHNRSYLWPIPPCGRANEAAPSNACHHSDQHERFIHYNTSFVRILFFLILLLLVVFIWLIIHSPIIIVKSSLLRIHHTQHTVSLTQAVHHLFTSSNTLTGYCLASIITLLIVLLPLVQYTLMIVLAITLNRTCPWQHLSSCRLPYRLLRVINILSHFASLEVFLVTIVVVSREVGQLISHERGLREFMSVHVQVLPGLYVLLMCVVLLGGCRVFMQDLVLVKDTGVGTVDDVSSGNCLDIATSSGAAGVGGGDAVTTTYFQLSQIPEEVVI